MKFVENVKFALYESYLAKIKNSVGTKLFKNTYGFINGQLDDLTGDGENSCGVHVSGILIMFGLIKEMHTTVRSLNGVVKDMIASNWIEIDELTPGAVILWEKQEKRNGPSEHVGFYIGQGKAISNLDRDYNAAYPGCPNEHSVDFDGTRKIEKIFWHDKLGKPEERKES